MGLARRLGVPLAVAILALCGCATEGGGPISKPESTSVRGTASPSMRAARDPATLSSCAKFDAMPHECEHSLGR